MQEYGQTGSGVFGKFIFFKKKVTNPRSRVESTLWNPQTFLTYGGAQGCRYLGYTDTYMYCIATIQAIVTAPSRVPDVGRHLMARATLKKTYLQSLYG